MAHVITSLCLRDSACVDVCPVECIVGGKPEAQWPWFYIDPATCIDCGACVPECPFEAIFPEVHALVGFGDGEWRHKDVWKHTKQVVCQSVPRIQVRRAALLHDAC